MRLTRCHVAQPLRVGEEPVLPEHAAAHLSRVLRLRPGDRCVLFNGDGHDYAAQLLAVGKRELRVRILERSAIDNESPQFTDSLTDIVVIKTLVRVVGIPCDV